jgi:hypothetical protein
MCLPPTKGHMAEWFQNLGGKIRFLGDDGTIHGYQTKHRKLMGYHIDTYDGGFITCGSVMEGLEIEQPGGWRSDAASIPTGGESYVFSPSSCVHQIAFVALPDHHTVVGLQYCRTEQCRTYLAEVKGLHLNVANDLYNHFKRRLTTAREEIVLESPAREDQVIKLGGKWINIDNCLGVVGIYGDEELAVHRSYQRRGGKYKSLYVDEICFHCEIGTQGVDPGTLVLDVGWAVISSADSGQTRDFEASPIEDTQTPIRGCRVQGLDGRQYIVIVNFDAEPRAYPVASLLNGAPRAQELSSGKTITDAEQSITIDSCYARIFERIG